MRCEREKRFYAFFYEYEHKKPFSSAPFAHLGFRKIFVCFLCILSVAYFEWLTNVC